jgi:hypothetical protein
MKEKSWVVVTISLLILFALPASAQCGLYTYQDIYIDSATGNFIGDNSAQADCVQSSAYSQSHVSMPSGSQNSASATGVT